MDFRQAAVAPYWRPRPVCHGAWSYADQRRLEREFHGLMVGGRDPYGVQHFLGAAGPSTVHEGRPPALDRRQHVAHLVGVALEPNRVVGVVGIERLLLEGDLPAFALAEAHLAVGVEFDHALRADEQIAEHAAEAGGRDVVADPDARHDSVRERVLRHGALIW